jgi:hypothetical protein
MQQALYDRLKVITDNLRELSAAVYRDTQEISASGDHIEIVKHFVQVRAVVELVKDSRESLKEMEDVLSRETIPEVFKQVREKTGARPPFYIEGVGRASVSHRYSCTMIEKEKAIDWLKANGHGGIVIETVNSQTLSSFSKSLLEGDGKELPADLFKVGTTPYTSITKA